MKPTRVNLVWDRKKASESAGKGLVEYYFYFPSGSKTYYSTGIFLQPEEWDNKRREVTPVHPNYIAINSYLKSQLVSISKFDLEMVSKGKVLSKQLLHEYFEFGKGISFTAYAKKQLEIANISSESASSQKRSLAILEEYAGKLSFNEITLDLMREFTKYMKVEKRYSPGNIWKVHKDIKKYVGIAVKQGHIKYQDNPYNSFKNIKPKGKEEYLTYEDLAALTELSPPGDLSLYRDIFLFSCYTGLRFSDLQLLNNKVVEEREGSLVLTMPRMVKVDKRVFLRLGDIFGGKPQEIIRPYLEKYRGEKYIWGKKIQNQTMNNALKVLQAEAGIETVLTVHLGRHTFGTLYAHQTGSIFDVMRAMGIAKFTTAQVYINLSAEL